MQFMVRIVVRLPGDWPKEKVDELAARETARGMQCIKEGKLRRIFRIVGQRANFSIWEAASPEELHATLLSLPMHPGLTATDIDASVTINASTYAAADTNTNMASGNTTPDFARSVEIYDSLGTPRTLTYGFLKSDTANQWYVEVYIDSSLADSSVVDGQVMRGVIAFNTNGTWDLSNSFFVDGAGNTLTDTDGDYTVDVPFDTTALGIDAQSITFDWGTDGEADGMTQYDGESTLVSTAVDGAQVGLVQHGPRQVGLAQIGSCQVGTIQKVGVTSTGLNWDCVRRTQSSSGTVWMACTCTSAAQSCASSKVTHSVASSSVWNRALTTERSQPARGAGMPGSPNMACSASVSASASSTETDRASSSSISASETGSPVLPSSTRASTAMFTLFKFIHLFHNYLLEK